MVARWRVRRKQDERSEELDAQNSEAASGREEALEVASRLKSEFPDEEFVVEAGTFPKAAPADPKDGFHWEEHASI